MAVGIARCFRSFFWNWGRFVLEDRADDLKANRWGEVYLPGLPIVRIEQVEGDCGIARERFHDLRGKPPAFARRDTSLGFNPSSPVCQPPCRLVVQHIAGNGDKHAICFYSDLRRADAMTG